VPRSLREGAYAVGGTRFDVAVRVVMPAALSGIVAAFLLAIARAVGETMIVALAAGSSPPSFTSFKEFGSAVNPENSTQTMTGYMVQIFQGDASNFGIEYLSSYAVAAALFALTFVITLIGHRVRVKYREVYE
jgi:phosphate transport system permease protein